ncbi:MAG: hypothetical protein ACXAC0_07655, partial [Candidatus Thorarchaeota archaeon]
AIIIFNFIWLIIAYLLPAAGWLLFGLYEALAVLFSLALAFAAVGYGFFILVAAMSKLRSPFQILPFHDEVPEKVNVIPNVLFEHWSLSSGTEHGKDRPNSEAIPNQSETSSSLRLFHRDAGRTGIQDSQYNHEQRWSCK